MDFMKKTLNQVNVQENTLYDIIYDLFFFAKLQESEDDIKNGRVCTLEELRQHINEYRMMQSLQLRIYMTIHIIFLLIMQVE